MSNPRFRLHKLQRFSTISQRSFHGIFICLPVWAWESKKNARKDHKPPVRFRMIGHGRVRPIANFKIVNL